MKVTLFKTADGTLHETKAAFVKARAILQMRPEVDAVIAAVPDSRFSDHGDGEPALGRGGLSEFILDNADALRKILNNGTVVKRAKRKPKTVQVALA